MKKLSDSRIGCLVKSVPLILNSKTGVIPIAIKSEVSQTEPASSQNNICIYLDTSHTFESKVILKEPIEIITIYKLSTYQ